MKIDARHATLDARQAANAVVSLRFPSRFSRWMFPHSPQPTAYSLSRSGFTLVEMLLVLTILGLLAAIVLPKFSGTTRRGRDTATQTQLAAFKTAINAFDVDMGCFPVRLADLIVQPRDATGWHGPYLDFDSIPKDPWGHDYLYVCPGSHNPASYDLMSMGADGRAGTDDDICNWTRQK